MGCCEEWDSQALLGEADSDPQFPYNFTLKYF